MDDKEILKQIYVQALSNRKEKLGAAPAPAPVPVPETPKVQQNLPEGVTERERILHDLMGVYRQKRQMIDDLPPKHRMLLEKMSRLMLGVKDRPDQSSKH